MLAQALLRRDRLINVYACASERIFPSIFERNRGAHRKIKSGSATLLPKPPLRVTSGA
jgi:hypothetical protein